MVVRRRGQVSRSATRAARARSRRSRSAACRPCVAPTALDVSCQTASETADVLRLGTLLSLGHLVLHLLALRKFTVAAAGDGREVDEDVCAAVVLLDEAEALVGVEPLD